MSKIRLSDLDRRIELWQDVPPFTLVDEVWASIDWATVGRGTTDFVIRCRMDVMPMWQVRYGGEIFRVVKVQECGHGRQMKEFHRLQCVSPPFAI